MPRKLEMRSIQGSFALNPSKWLLRMNIEKPKETCMKPLILRQDHEEVGFYSLTSSLFRLDGFFLSSDIGICLSRFTSPFVQEEGNECRRDPKLRGLDTGILDGLGTRSLSPLLCEMHSSPLKIADCWLFPMRGTSSYFSTVAGGWC